MAHMARMFGGECLGICRGGLSRTMEPRFLFSHISGSASLPATVQLAIASIAFNNRPILVDGSHVDGGIAHIKVTTAGTPSTRESVTVDLYLSSDKVLDSTDVMAGMETRRNVRLKAGASQIFSERLLPTPTLTPGLYYVFAVAKPVSSLPQGSSGGVVAISDRQIVVADGHFPIHRHWPCYDQTYDGVVVDDTGDDGSEGTIVETPMPSDVQPSSQPTTIPPPSTDPSTNPDTNPAAGADNAPATNPSAPPDSQPASDPAAPTTGATTDTSDTQAPAPSGDSFFR